MTILDEASLTQSGRPVLDRGEYEVIMLDKVGRGSAPQEHAREGPDAQRGYICAPQLRSTPDRPVITQLRLFSLSLCPQVDLEFASTGGLPGQLAPAYKVNPRTQPTTLAHARNSTRHRYCSPAVWCPPLSAHTTHHVTSASHTLAAT